MNDTPTMTADEAVEKFEQTIDNKTHEEVVKYYPDPVNRAQRRARKYTKTGKATAKHVDNLQQSIKQQLFKKAIESLQHMNDKAEDKLNGNEAN